MIKYFIHVILQLKGRLLFGVKVGVLGNFTVVNSKNVSIGSHCAINHGVFILGRHRITIGSHVVLSARCMLIDAGLDKNEFSTQPFPKHTSGPITIGDGAWVGAGAIILSNVTIGRKAIIGAGAIVTKDVPDFAIVAGNPARVIGMIND